MAKKKKYEGLSGKEKMKRELMDRRDVKNPEALLAWLGRKKYGKKEMASRALEGRI